MTPRLSTYCARRLRDLRARGLRVTGPVWLGAGRGSADEWWSCSFTLPGGPGRQVRGWGRTAEQAVLRAIEAAERAPA